MKGARTSRLWLHKTGVATLVALVLVYAGVLFVKNRSLFDSVAGEQNVHRYVNWGAFQLSLAQRQLLYDLERFATNPTADTLGEARESFDVYWSRFGPLLNGEGGENTKKLSVDHHRSLEAMFAELRQYGDAIDGLSADRAGAARARAVQERMSRHREVLVPFTSSVTGAAERATAKVLDAIRLAKRHASIVLSLTLVSVLLLGLSLYRSLSRSEASARIAAAEKDRFADFAHAASDWFFETGSDLVVRHSGGGGGGLGGCSAGLAGTSLAEVLVTDDRSRRRLAVALERRTEFKAIPIRVSCEGQVGHFRLAGRPVFEEGRFAGYRGTVADVTSEVLDKLTIERMARTDALTGLPNRACLTEHLERALNASPAANVALMFCDLDGFKAVNDTYGHEAGDALLREIASNLAALARDYDVLPARLGGDEFAVLFDLDNAAGVAASFAEDFLALAKRPIRYHEASLTVTGSCGLAVADAHQRADEIMRNADAALYAAKADGKSCCRMFDAAMRRTLRRRRNIRYDLDHAIERGELAFHYQPQFTVSADGPRLAGAEALMRWRHGRWGDIPPSLFIPIAEETNLIVALGRYTVHRVLSEAQHLVPGRCLPVALNISPAQLRRTDFLAEIDRSLLEAAVAPALLEVEITEGLLMSDVKASLEVLNGLAERGVSVAVDDFGTGYSSLAYLKRFPVSKLKVDRAFVQDLDKDSSSDRTIVSAVIGLAHGLGLKVVAEGAETSSQINALRRLGCDYVQGFALGRPMPLERFAATFAERDEAA